MANNDQHHQAFKKALTIPVQTGKWPGEVVEVHWSSCLLSPSSFMARASVLGAVEIAKETAAQDPVLS